MTILYWLTETLGLPYSNQSLFIFYILGGVILFIILDGIISFFVSGITSLTQRGRK